jgi:hypothetical protein
MERLYCTWLLSSLNVIRSQFLVRHMTTTIIMTGMHAELRSETLLLDQTKIVSIQDRRKECRTLRIEERPGACHSKNRIGEIE